MAPDAGLDVWIERALVVGKPPLVRPEDLPVSLAPGAGLAPPVGDSLAEVEKAHVRAILERTGWNVSRAARILDIDRVTLYNKIKKYELSQTSSAALGAR